MTITSNPPGPKIKIGKQARSPGAASKKPFIGKPKVEVVWVNFDLAKGLTGIKAHDMVTTGVPVATVSNMMRAYRFIGADKVLKVMGISERTLQRAITQNKPLDTNASDRALRLASVTAQAIGVLGTQDAAERWLSAPAIGLDQRTPIDLLQSSEGTELVKTLLTRMDYGVYS